jgi:MFS family permease
MGWAWLYPLALCASVIAFSVLMPRVAVQLSQAGHTGLQVGLFSMITFLVVFLSTPLMPRLYRRFGINLAYLLGLGFNFIAVLGLTSFKRYDWLCLSAVFSGFAACCLWSATETLIACNAPAHRLGSITGLYQSLLGLTLALGPFVPGFMAWGDAEVRWFVVSSLGLALTLVLWARVLRLRIALGEDHPASGGSWRKVLSKMPILLLAAFVGGVFEAGISNVGSVQTARYGVAESQAVFFAGAIAFGSLAMQWPMGVLADRISDQRLLHLSLWILLLTSLLARIWSSSLPVWWLSALLWGGVGGALYTLAMISVGHQFRGNNTAQYASASIAAYTLGCILGPFMSGAALDLDPRHGMTMLLVLLTLMALAAFYWLKRRTLVLQSR